MRLPNVENEEIIATIEARLQFPRRYFRNLDIRHRGFFAADTAEFVVVDEFGDGRICAADRAVRILTQLQFAELHGKCVEKQQTAYEAISAADDELDRLHGLNRADDAGQNAKHASFG